MGLTWNILFSLTAVTGTIPTGLALLRIIDSKFETTTAVELGLMNLPMLLSMVTVFSLVAIISDATPLHLGYLLLLAPIPIYIILLKVYGLFGSKSYSFSSKDHLYMSHSKGELASSKENTDQ